MYSKTSAHLLPDSVSSFLMFKRYQLIIVKIKPISNWTITVVSSKVDISYKKYDYDLRQKKCSFINLCCFIKISEIFDIFIASIASQVKPNVHTLNKKDIRHKLVLLTNSPFLKYSSALLQKKELSTPRVVGNLTKTLAKYEIVE